jgi:hypothetical protein
MQRVLQLEDVADGVGWVLSGRNSTYLHVQFPPAGSVARLLADGFNVVVLLATSEHPDTLHGFGAEAVLSKPYNPADVPAAFEAAEQFARGEDPGQLPDRMKRLVRDRE